MIQIYRGIIDLVVEGINANKVLEGEDSPCGSTCTYAGTCGRVWVVDEDGGGVRAWACNVVRVRENIEIEFFSR